MSYKITSQPTFYPVRLQDMKVHLEVDTDDDDDLINHLISEAVGHLESYIRGSMALTTYKIVLDEFEDIINLDRYPLSSIISVKYYNSLDVLTTMATSAYREDLNSTPPRLEIITIPTIKSRIGAVEITAVFGYDDTDDIPKELIQAVKKMVKDWYDCPSDDVREMKTASMRLMDMHRMKRF